MSKNRMTDKEFDSRAPWCHKGQADRHTQDRIAKEAKRARSEEARLLEENRKQAETIKALEEALELSGAVVDGRWHHHSCISLALATGLYARQKCTESCLASHAALRLAGRLK